MRSVVFAFWPLVGLTFAACGAGSPSHDSMLAKWEGSTYHGLYQVSFHSTIRDEVTGETRETFKRRDLFREDWQDQDGGYSTFDVDNDFNVACVWDSAGSMGGGGTEAITPKCERVAKPFDFSGLPTYSRGGQLINYDSVEGYDAVKGRDILGEVVRCFRSTSDNFTLEECFTEDGWLAFAQTTTGAGISTMEALELSSTVRDDAFVIPS